jgi:hypothetical protein
MAAWTSRIKLLRLVIVVAVGVSVSSPLMMMKMIMKKKMDYENGMSMVVRGGFFLLLKWSKLLQEEKCELKSMTIDPVLLSSPFLSQHVARQLNSMLQAVCML